MLLSRPNRPDISQDGFTFLGCREGKNTDILKNWPSAYSPVTSEEVHDRTDSHLLELTLSRGNVTRISVQLMQMAVLLCASNKTTQ